MLHIVAHVMVCRAVEQPFWKKVLIRNEHNGKRTVSFRSVVLQMLEIDVTMGKSLWNSDLSSALSVLLDWNMLLEHKTSKLWQIASKVGTSSGEVCCISSKAREYRESCDG